MHDHEQAAALDRPRGQAVGRRPLVGGDLRRRRTARHRTTPPRQRPRAATPRPSSTRSRRRSRSARPRCRSGTRRRSRAASCRVASNTTAARSRSRLRRSTSGSSPARSRTRRQLSFVRTVKQWVGATSSAEIFVDRDGTTPYDASTTATASGDNTSFVYPTSTPVFVGETTVPAGYEAEIACGHTQPRQPYTGGPFPVTSPAQHLGVLTCTVTNSQLFSTVQVVKQWIGTPASTTIFVDQDGAAPYDASTVATASGDSASFTYPVSTPVTVGETPVPAGYAATIDCGQGPQPYTGGPFPVTSPADGDEVTTCTITNTELRSTVQVVKDWAGAPSSATLFVDANGTAPYDASTVATASGQSASFDVPRLDTGRRRRDRACPSATRRRSIAAAARRPTQAAPSRSPRRRSTAPRSPARSSTRPRRQCACSRTGPVGPSTTTIFVDSERPASVRCLHARLRGRAERLLRLPALDPGHGRRGRATVWIPFLHQLRYGPAGSPPLRGRPALRREPGRPERRPDLHDHERSARDRSWPVGDRQDGTAEGGSGTGSDQLPHEGHQPRPRHRPERSHL